MTTGWPKSRMVGKKLSIWPSGFYLFSLPVLAFQPCQFFRDLRDMIDEWHHTIMGFFWHRVKKYLRLMNVYFYTTFLYIAYMQFLKMHLLHTSFTLVVILNSCNSHFLICLSVHPKNYLSCLSFPLANFLKTKAQKPLEKETSVEYQ